MNHSKGENGDVESSAPDAKNREDEKILMNITRPDNHVNHKKLIKGKRHYSRYASYNFVLDLDIRD